MTELELFEGIKLLVNLPEHNIYSGMQGAIVECYLDKAYEVEFTNLNGESIALCTLSPEQFIVVWKAKTKTWLSVAEQVAAIVNRLSEERRQEVLDFAVFCVRGS
jgi:hypothetical protein